MLFAMAPCMPAPLPHVTCTPGSSNIFICGSNIFIIINRARTAPDEVFVIDWDAEVDLIMHLAVLWLPLSNHGDLLKTNSMSKTLRINSYKK